jgi:hypothetical protein
VSVCRRPRSYVGTVTAGRRQKLAKREAAEVSWRGKGSKVSMLMLGEITMLPFWSFYIPMFIIALILARLEP